MGWHIYLLLPTSHCILHIDGVWHSKKQSRNDDSMACKYGDCNPVSAGIWTLAAWRVLYICKFLYYVLVVRFVHWVFSMRINVHEACLTAICCNFLLLLLHCLFGQLTERAVLIRQMS